MDSKPIKGQFQSRETSYDRYERVSFEDKPKAKVRAKAKPKARTGAGKTVSAKKYRNVKTFRQPEVGGPMAVKIAICLTVLLLCVAVKLSDADIAVRTGNMMKNALTYDIDVEESLGQLKFVQELFPGATTVFNGSNGMRYPIDGNVTKSFEDMLEQGIELTGNPGAKVYAAMDGTVEKRGKNAELGNYLRIKHSGSVDTYYFNLKRSSLNEGEAVTRGQEIAELGEDGVLVFEVHVRGNSRNPLEYLGKN